MQRTESLVNVERLVALALVLGGVAAMALAVTVDVVSGGDLSEFGPNQLSLMLSGFVVLTTGIVLISPPEQRYIGEWLLVGLGVLAAAFASDLLVVGGLPSMYAKHLLLASVVGGLLVVGAAPNLSDDRRDVRDWLDLLAFDRDRVARLASIVLQLGVLILVVRQFQLENQAFYHNLVLLTFYGFLIHYVLPAQYRLSFVFMLSVAAILGIFGLTNGLWIIGFGLGLIALCHLPVSIWLRVVILLAVGGGLALMRMGQITVPVSGAVWPILGSLFMFRLIVYLYDLKHKKEGETFSLSRTLSYFFLLPNLVFLLFPVVDYSTFRRTYYDDEEHKIYQTGVAWILRGVIQLIVYRFVNYYLVISPQEVAHAGDLVHYMVANILLLVRVTGQFHIAVGILHLFGFNLPQTNDRYFLAAGFTDFWRRANIYWKDFMLKVFYYPTYFRFRNLGDMSRLTLATVFAFFVTWVLHWYQWFWLRGSLILSLPDILFWTFFGLLVLGNALYEAKKGRKRSLGTQKWSFRETAFTSLGVVGTFSTIVVLWTLWTSPSVSDWLSLLSVAATPLTSITDLTPLFVVLGGLVGATFWYSREGGPLGKQPSFFRSAVVTGATILMVFALGNPAVYTRIGGRPEEVLADLRQARLSDRDAELLLRGYYEDLVGINRFNTELWDVYTKRPSDWPLLQDTELARLTDNFYSMELIPSTSTYFHGAQFSVNRWGMRDRDYDLTPPPDTYRVALLGPSFVMGSGVADDETFEWVLEDRLNREHAGEQHTQYQILNFGVASYSALQEVAALEEKALRFEPDAIFLVAHQHEEDIAVRNLAGRVSAGVEIPYEYLNEVVQRAGVEGDVTTVEAERRLQPYKREVLTWAYSRIAETARANGAVPIWIYMPTLEVSLADQDGTELARLAEETGFVTINLSDVYDGHDLESIIVAEWDKHPNARAHRLLADRLYQALVERQETIPLTRSVE